MASRILNRGSRLVTTMPTTLPTPRMTTTAARIAHPISIQVSVPAQDTTQSLLPGPYRSFHSTHPCLSSSSPTSTTETTTVPLAYDQHDPSTPKFPSTQHPILFLHGLFGSKKNNRSLSRALARDTGRTVYALDLRNHGESPHIPRHDYVAMSDDIAAFIHEHKLQEPTIIGHSMGAKTAMTLALRMPDLVRDVVAVDNAPVDATLASDFARYIQGMRKIDQLGVVKQSEADRVLMEYEKSLPIRQFLLANLKKPSPPEQTSSLSKQNNNYRFRIPIDILGRALNNLGDFPFRNPSEVRFMKPALFVRGSLSKYVPDEVIPLIGQFFPYFKVVDIECGHWVTAEKPEEFKKVVIDFFDREESETVFTGPD